MEIERYWGTLLVIENKEKKVFPLKKTELYIGRSDPSKDWKPDIGFGHDLMVSRKHARLFFKDNKWWLEDLGSKRGTLINGEEVAITGQATHLPLNVPVQMGSTKWVLLPPYTASWEGLVVSFDLVSYINYAAYHCGIPIVSNLSITNHNTSASKPFNLRIEVPGWSLPWEKRVRPLLKGGQEIIDTVQLVLLYEKLEGLEGKRTGRLEVRANGTLIFATLINLLGFYEWPLHREYRKTLACFVQPAHPVVEHIVMEVCFKVKKIERGNILLTSYYGQEFIKEIAKSLYELLCSYNIAYVQEAPSYEAQFQVVRLPHRVIPRLDKKSGSGTCLDLALLFAGCLEGLRLQPLVIVVKEEAHSLHAIVGFWKSITLRVEPIISEYKRFQKLLESDQIVLIEATGITDRFKDQLGRKLSYEEAKRETLRQVNSLSFVFAIDVAAARQTVPPLQLPVEPKVSELIRIAIKMAMNEIGNDRIETRHLLYSVLLSKDEQIVRVLSITRIDLSYLRAVTHPVDPSLMRFVKPTVNYRRALEDARLIMGDVGDVFIRPIHVLYALLVSQSRSVDEILSSIGTNRNKLIKAVNEEVGWDEKIIQTQYEGL